MVKLQLIIIMYVFKHLNQNLKSLTNLYIYIYMSDCSPSHSGSYLTWEWLESRVGPVTGSSPARFSHNLWSQMSWCCSEELWMCLNLQTSTLQIPAPWLAERGDSGCSSQSERSASGTSIKQISAWERERAMLDKNKWWIKHKDRQTDELIRDISAQVGF